MGITRFGVFELDAAAGELHRRGRRVHLAGQPLKVLALLTSRSGAIVTRKELRRHLWSDGTFVEFDRGLNFAIAEVRAALGDDARHPRFIETIPKRGYRFIADVHAEEEARASRTASLRYDMRAALAAAMVLLVAQQPLRLRAHTRLTALPAARTAFDRAMTLSDENDAGRRSAISALRTATRLDPRFAEAYYALGELYLDLALKRDLPVDAAVGEARAAVERAVALEEMPESRRLLGTIRLVADRDWTGARRDLARAVALEPKWDLGFVAYARLLSAGGDDAGAIAAIDRAETLSPNCDLILFEAGGIYARAGRTDEALDKLERAITFGPPRGRTIDDWSRQVRSRQFMISMARGDWTAAHRTAAKLVALSGATDAVRQAFESSDDTTALDTFLARSVAITLRDAGARRAHVTQLAALEALRGRADAALDWLEQAEADRNADLLYVLRDPELSVLRPLPRYQQLVARVHRRAPAVRPEIRPTS
jgi:DNA-binding winged helix-turn-helix (wHTH) protein